MVLASLHPKAPLLARKMKKKTGERARDGTGQSPAPIGLASLYPKAPQKKNDAVLEGQAWWGWGGGGVSCRIYLAIFRSTGIYLSIYRYLSIDLPVSIYRSTGIYLSISVDRSLLGLRYVCRYRETLICCMHIYIYA
jgi:hypothetical protein